MTEQRGEVFTFRVSESERRMITAMARRLQRNQSDAVRLIVTEAAAALLASERREAHDGQSGG